jgi:putative endonuclease
MAVKDDIGRQGEDLAADFLESVGLVVLTRNWRCSEGEIDIVATDDRHRMVVCEVKTRTGLGYGVPAEAVTLAKRRKLRRLAQIWAGRYGHGWFAIRFDVVSVLLLPGEEPRIHHIPEAF